jgi:hypothetical protein
MTANADTPFQVQDRRRHDFTIIDNVIFRKYLSLIGAYCYTVYSILCFHADNTTRECWPSLATIAAETGMSRRQVIREIAKLVELGLVAVEKQVNPETGEYSSNLYILLDVTEPGQGKEQVVNEIDHPTAVAERGGDTKSPGSDSQSPGGSDSQTLGGDSQSPKQDPLKNTQHRNKIQGTHARGRTRKRRKSTHSNQRGGGDLPSSVPSEIPSWLTDEFSELAGQEPSAKDLSELETLSHYPKETIDDALAAARAWLDNPTKEPIKSLAAWLSGTAQRMQERAGKRGSAGHCKNGRQRTDEAGNASAKVEELMEYQRERREAEAEERTAEAVLVAEEVSEEERTWQAVLDELKLQMPPATYEMWVVGSSLLSIENGVATIQAAHENARGWMEARMRTMISRELGYVLKTRVEPQFVVGC